jgi:hypothetical protein
MKLADFYVGYMQNRLERGEFVRALHVPRNEGWQVAAWKIAKRFDSDISGVFGAFALRLEGERIADLRLAFGGLAATSKRAAHAEHALRGQPWSETALRTAQAALVRGLPAPERPARQPRLPAAGRTSAAAPPVAGHAPGRSPFRSISSASGRPAHDAIAHRQRAPARVRRICMWPERRPTPTTCPSAPAPCTPRSASRRSRMAACWASMWRACARSRVWSMC